jgi:hypothetical protein
MARAFATAWVAANAVDVFANSGLESFFKALTIETRR